MLQFFRSLFKSRIGLAVVFGFLGLIALAFASSDISGSRTFGGIAGGDRVAIVGDTKIGTAELVRAANDALRNARQDDPTLSMQAFVAQGGLNDTLDLLIDRAAFREYTKVHGLRAGSNLVNSEIRQIAAFRGPDGNFSEDVYRRALAQQGFSDKQVRADLGTALLVQQLILPASTGTVMPDALAKRYAQLFKERRVGTVLTLPALAFAPGAAPTGKQLADFYSANKSKFIRPERRTIQYATFDASALGSSIEPTSAEIAERYKRDAARYAASETRDFTQLIVPTQAAAESIRSKVATGGSLEAAAQAAGLRTSKIAGSKRAALRSQFSAAVADAYFSASKGALTNPVRSPLGWHIARVDSVETRAARTLDQARGEIREALLTEKRATGLADLAIRIEGLLDEGATFAEVAKEFALAPKSTAPLIATGQVYGSLDQKAPEEVLPALQSAFQMDEEEPEVAPLGTGGTYLLYEVKDVTPSAAAPLAEIRNEVAAAWKRDAGAKSARAAADRVLANLAKNMTLAQALQAAKVSGGKIEPVDLTREQLARMGGQRIPPPIALLFSMAQGTAKKLEAPDDMGWMVVALDKIALDDIAANDPLIAQARAELGRQVGQEYAEELRTALRKAVGVERNTAALAAVRKQLLGQN